MTYCSQNNDDWINARFNQKIQATVYQDPEFSEYGGWSFAHHCVSRPQDSEPFGGTTPLSEIKMQPHNHISALQLLCLIKCYSFAIRADHLFERHEILRAIFEAAANPLHPGKVLSTGSEQIYSYLIDTEVQAINNQT